MSITNSRGDRAVCHSLQHQPKSFTKCSPVLAEDNSALCNATLKHEPPHKASTLFLLIPMLQHSHPCLPLQEVCLNSTSLNSKIQLLLKRQISKRPWISTGTSSNHLCCKKVKENSSKDWLLMSPALEFSLSSKGSNHFSELKA